MGFEAVRFYLCLYFYLSLIQMRGGEHHGSGNIPQVVPMSSQELAISGQALQGIRWPMYHPQTGTYTRKI